MYAPGHKCVRAGLQKHILFGLPAVCRTWFSTPTQPPRRALRQYFSEPVRLLGHMRPEPYDSTLLHTDHVYTVALHTQQHRIYT